GLQRLITSLPPAVHRHARPDCRNHSADFLRGTAPGPALLKPLWPAPAGTSSRRGGALIIPNNESAAGFFPRAALPATSLLMAEAAPPPSTHSVARSLTSTLTVER